MGCGCRGRELAAALMAEGHAVRGSSRDAGRRQALEALGAEAVEADPDLLGTLMPHLAGVTVLVWLLGEAGNPALHRERLSSLLEKLVDTPVRAFVYEKGSDEGEAIARRASKTWHFPITVVAPGEDVTAAALGLLR